VPAQVPAKVRPPGPAERDVLDAPRVQGLPERGWVEVRAAVLASDDEAPSSARRRAVGRARQAAVEHVAGVRVRSSLLSLDQFTDGEEGSLLQVLSASRSDALIVHEELVRARVAVLASGGYRMDVTLRAQVLDRARAAGGEGRGDGESFATEVRLNRDVFRDGEEVELSVRASEAARLYVIAVSDDGAVMLVLNRHLREAAVEAGVWLHFPDPRLKERGVHLRAQLPAGKSHAEEALIVIAIRGRRQIESPVPASGAGFASASRGQAAAMLGDLLAPLANIPARDWTFDQLAYRIRAR